MVDGLSVLVPQRGGGDTLAVLKERHAQNRTFFLKKKHPFFVLLEMVFFHHTMEL